MIDFRKLICKYTSGNAELYDLLTAHSEAVARKALELAERHPELEMNRVFIQEAAMLHDIGVTMCDAPSIHCYGKEPYIRHGIAGAEILRAEGLPLHARVAERHTGAGITADYIANHNLPLPLRDFLPETLEEMLICYADKFFSKSRRADEEKPLEKIMIQMASLGDDSLERFRSMHNLFS